MRPSADGLTRLAILGKIPTCRSARGVSDASASPTMNNANFLAPFSLVFAALALASAPAALVPVSPVGGEVVARVPDAQKKVMDLPALEDRIALFREDREHGGKVIRHDPFWRKAPPLVLKWRATEGETGPWKIEIATDPEFSAPEVFYVGVKSVDPATGRETDRDLSGLGGELVSYTVPRANLEIGRAFWWRVAGLGKPEKGKKEGPLVHSQAASFATEDRAPRWIAIEGRVGNIRDFGGRRTEDGRRVRQGMAFRGQGLNDNSVTGERQGRNRLTVEDVRYFTRTLGIRTDLDLRSKRDCILLKVQCFLLRVLRQVEQRY